jgi:hypothetical protein
MSLLSLPSFRLFWASRTVGSDAFSQWTTRLDSLLPSLSITGVSALGTTRLIENLFRMVRIVPIFDSYYTIAVGPTLLTVPFGLDLDRVWRGCLSLSLSCKASVRCNIRSTRMLPFPSKPRSSSFLCERTRIERSLGGKRHWLPTSWNASQLFGWRGEAVHGNNGWIWNKTVCHSECPGLRLRSHGLASVPLGYIRVPGWTLPLWC